jgi:hypothetical protein
MLCSKLQDMLRCQSPDAHQKGCGCSTDWAFACSGVLQAVAGAGGAALWASNGKPFEEALALCVLHLDDASRATGDAMACALGQFLTASTSDAAVEAVRHRFTANKSSRICHQAMCYHFGSSWRAEE